MTTDNKKTILALGAESAGNFTIFHNGEIFCSACPELVERACPELSRRENFGDLLEEDNFQTFQKFVLEYLAKNKLKPDVVVCDLHPLYRTTEWGRGLANQFGAEFVQVQHHVAHIFSAVGDKLILPEDNPREISLGLSSGGFIGIACDGTGFGLDGKIWGGEVFVFSKSEISNSQSLISNKIPNFNDQSLKQVPSSKFQVSRIGHLENQIMIGGDLAVREPARMLISILDKIRNPKSEIRNKSEIKNYKSQKDFVYNFVKNFYAENEFEVLYNQLQQGFNCVETSSTGRILDAVSVLLGFAKNERGSKHEATELLEKASEGVEPYDDIEPVLEVVSSKQQVAWGKRGEDSLTTYYILHTTNLFEYLIKALEQGKDKNRLAVTAQLYIAEGLWEIIKKINSPQPSLEKEGVPVYFAGGMANNKIISECLQSKGVYVSQDIPRGDSGISLGQVMYVLLNP